MVKTKGRRRRTSNYIKRRNNTLKTITYATNKALPVIDNGLRKIGNVAKKSVPVVETGVAGVYGAMKSGLDLGTKTIKRISTTGKTRSISLSGGRKSKKYW